MNITMSASFLFMGDYVIEGQSDGGSRRFSVIENGKGRGLSAFLSLTVLRLGASDYRSQLREERESERVRER